MTFKIQMRRSTSYEWASSDPILAVGEIGVISDTTDMKVGDGITHWNALPYFGLPKYQPTQPIPRHVGDLWYDTDDDFVLGISANAPTTYTRLDYGPSLRPGLVWAFIGDSITNGSGASTFGRSFVGETIQMVGGLVASMQSIEAGTVGDTTTNIVSRLNTIMASDFRGSVLLAGTNDVSQGVSLDTTVANYKILIARLRSRGPVILCTIPPLGYTSPTYDVPDANQYKIDGINTWIRTYGPDLGCEVADVFSAIVDTSDGSNVSAWNSGDGVHPGNKGHTLIAFTIAAAMQKITRSPSPNSLIVSDSASCLTPDPLCVGGSTMPSGWSERAGGTGTTPTYSLVADISSFLPLKVNSVTGLLEAGKWAQMSWTATTGGTRSFEIPIDLSTWAVGDSVAICSNIQIEDVFGSNTWWQDVVNGVAEVTISVIDQSSVVISGIPLDRCSGIRKTSSLYNIGPIVWPFIIPVGTTSMKLLITVKLSSGTTRNVRVGNTALLSLTNLSLQNTIGAWTNTTVRT